MSGARWPALPELKADEVHVYRLSLAAPPNPPAAVNEADLSLEERRRAERFLNGPARAQFVTVRWSLRAVLGRHLGVSPAQVPLETTATGRPVLRGPAGAWRCSVSHSRDVALLALTRHLDLGVDLEVEGPDTDLPAVAGRFFTPAERLALSQLPTHQRRRAFYRGWTRREAALKALGRGLADGPRVEVNLAAAPRNWLRAVDGRPVPDWLATDLEAPAGAHAALVVCGGEGRRIKSIELT